MPKLSLVELEAFDPNARPGGRERRFCCPLCHGARSKDANHRTLAVATDTGKWFCHRCKEKGLLSEFQAERSDAPKGKPKPKRFSGMPGSLSRPQHIATQKEKAPTETAKPYDFKTELHQVGPIKDTLGAAYLEGRGIPLAVAEGSRVRFAAKILGHSSAVVFPLVNEDKTLVAMQARAAHTGDTWKRTLKNTDGPHEGVFVTPGAFDAAYVVIVEAPIDALSLAACGVPAIATVGTTFPEWLAPRLALRSVLLAHDADQAGEDAVTNIAGKLRAFGATPQRLRPPKGFKDWNEALKALGIETLRAMLAPIAPAMALSTPLTPSEALRPVQRHVFPGDMGKNREVEGVMIYTPDMGEICLDAPTDVMIAGKVRKGLVWLRPDLIPIYEMADRATAR